MIRCGRSADAEARRGMLQGAAEAIASSLADGSEWRSEGPMQQLRDAFLAECRDESKAAANRCRRLRKELATALRRSLKATHGHSPLLLSKGKRSSATPGVWVEVRGTAGRNLIDGALTIGRDPNCDVQVWGDDTVLPVQLIAVSLPGGVVIVDAWSGGCTRAIWRHGGKHSELGVPPALPSHVSSLTVSHKERLVLCVGTHTPITLGPAKKANRRERKKVRACGSSVHSSPAVTPTRPPCDPPPMNDDGDDDSSAEPIAKKPREEHEMACSTKSSTSLDSEGESASSRSSLSASRTHSKDSNMSDLKESESRARRAGSKRSGAHSL